MSKTELLDIWEQAVANVENNAGNYFYDREVEVDVDGGSITLLFEVDADPTRDTIDSAIYYQTISGGADDLVYAKQHPNGHNVSEVLQSSDEFIDRVHNIAEEWYIF